MSAHISASTTSHFAAASGNGSVDLSSVCRVLSIVARWITL